MSCVFLGYSPDHHGYRCFDPKNERLYIVRHVRFNELCFPYAKPQPIPSDKPEPDPYISLYPNPTPFSTDTSTQTNHPNNPPTSPPPSPISVPPPPLQFTYQRRPKPAHNTAIPTVPTTAHNNEPPETTIRQRPTNLRPNPKPAKPYNASSFHSTTTNPDTEPASFTVANKLPQWRDAMAAEYSALVRNGTWTLVPRAPGSNIVDCKWVYKIKRDHQGAIQRYKARLVAKGFRQQQGIDYEDTFSPVVKATTIRLVLSLAVTQKWALRQLDIQNAFLHGDLKETVYLQQPQGFVDPQKPDHVCLLHKSLYGLKQAPRAWFHQLSTTLHGLGFQGSKTDPSLFIYSSGGTLLYMLVYVDDIILTGNNQREIDNVVQHLGRIFPV